MTQLHPRPLAFAVSAVLGLIMLLPAAAAQDRISRIKEPAKATVQPASEMPVQTPALFPDATRVAPDVKASGKMVKSLQALQALYEQKDMAAVIVQAEAIAAMPAANAYEKSFVFSMAANAAADQDDQAKAADYFRKAVEADGLDNDGHFGTMFNLAVIEYGLDRFPAALATMDRFLAETRSSKPEHQGFRAGILANMDRHDEAAAIYKSLVASKPSDKRLLMNAVAAFQGADNFDQANALLADAHQRGMLTEPRELRALYIGYMNAQRWTEAQKVIEDGLAKNILQAGPDLSRDFQVLAQNAYMDDKVALAIELYTKAAPMAADGEAYLNLAKVLEFAGKKTEAKAAAKQALDKGVKKPDEAKALIAR